MHQSTLPPEIHNQTHDKWSLLAATFYLLMIPFGLMGILYLPNNILVPGNDELTYNNFLIHRNILPYSVLSALVVQILQILTVVCLYKFFKTTGKSTAKLMVLFTIIAVPIAMYNEITLLAALLLQSMSLSSLSNMQIADLVLFALYLHEQGVMIVHVFWGLWLIPMGILTYKHNGLPSIVGVLLVIGGCGYILDTITVIATQSRDFMIAQYTFIGEVLLPLALIRVWYKSRNKQN